LRAQYARDLVECSRRVEPVEGGGRGDDVDGVVDERDRLSGATADLNRQRRQQLAKSGDRGGSETRFVVEERRQQVDR
jgi:hypothetical protein